MKTLLRTFVMVLCLARMEAAVLDLEGELSWEITEPRCSFLLDGDLLNIGPDGSGTLKLVLWATANPFPSPGHIVGETNLGQLAAGSRFSDFTIRTGSKVPIISGTYHFTIAIAEYTTAGWRNRLAVATGTRALAFRSRPESARTAGNNSLVCRQIPA